MRKVRRCIRKILWNETGNITPLAVALVIAMLLLMLVIAEWLRLVIMASGVKDAFEEAIISVVTENYNETYHCVREGYAGGYEPTGSGFYESVDVGDVRGRLSRLLGLKTSGANLVKEEEAREEYRIGEIAVTVKNTHLRSGGEKFSADGELMLSLPVWFNGRKVFTIPIRLKVRALMREKF